jgi:hypothetical protein
MKAGWRFEGHRHSLAARGIKTSSYYSWKDSIANAISKNTADPGQEEVQMANLKAKDEMRGEIIRMFHEDVKKDKLRPEKEDDLLQEFGFLARAFTERKEMNAHQFRERSRDMYKDFRKRNLKTLTIMGVDE